MLLQKQELVSFLRIASAYPTLMKGREKMKLEISTSSGVCEGYEEKGVRVWKGIPYASDYTGLHCFQSAKPCEKWEGVKKTVSFPLAAPQLPKKVCGIAEGVPTDENSLCINIWATEQTEKLKPVMVWIYGGAFVSGDAGIDLYDGRRLARREDVIVASFNFRINALGFLDFSSVIPEAESNVGLRDQVLALKWIYENIEAFGGDQENITIFGQSAGGHSVTTLLSIPSARKYIAKAIAMSSYPLSVNTKEQAALYASRFLEVMEIEPKDARKLFSLPADKLVEAAKILEDEVSSLCNFDFAFLPTVDGDFLPMTPLESAALPKEKVIPLIIGNVTDEGSLYTFSPIPFFPTTYNTIKKFIDLNREWESAEIKKLYREYPAEKRMYKLGGDIAFGVPCLIYADAYSRNAPVWVYRFSYYPLALKVKKLYSMHGTDMPFAFNNLKCDIAKQSLKITPDKSVANRIKRELSHDFAVFALEGKASWRPYSETKRKSKEFCKTSRTVNHPLARNIDVFKNTEYFRKKMTQTEPKCDIETAV